MCGIVGFIKTQPSYLNNAEMALRNSIYFQRLRGIDALGMVKVKDQDDFQLIKSAGEPLKLLQQKDFSKFLNGTGDNALVIAHNRHATKGEKNDSTCAHPFNVEKKDKSGRIILVHNGTVNTTSENDKKFDGKSDSHQLAKMIASGMNLADVEFGIWGSFALVWYDSSDHTVNFFRNEERPLGMVYSKDSIWFGSELYTIAGAMERNNLNVKEMHRIPPMEHWNLTLKDGILSKKPVEKRPILNPSHGVSCSDPLLLEILSSNDSMSEECLKAARDFVSGTKTGGIAISEQGSRTKVIPYENRYPPSSPTKNYPHYRSSQRKAERFDICAEAPGYKKGETVIFALSNHTATIRPTQTKLEGQAVSFIKGKTPNLEMSLRVVGMVGMDISMVDQIEKLWEGVVGTIMQSRDNEHVYLLSLKDVKPTADVDTFKLEEVKSHSNPLDVEFEERFGPIDEKLKNPTFICFNCNKTKLVSQGKHRVQEGRVDENSTIINLCKECMDEVVLDISRLHALFANARIEQEQTRH